jgi:hypothetical protein
MSGIESNNDSINPESRTAKSFLYASYVSLLFVTYGLGSFLHEQQYHPIAFIIIYLVLLTWPFVWALPHSDLDQFNFENGIAIGVVTVIIFGIIHLIHAFTGGSNDFFRILIPMVALYESVVVSDYFIKRATK